MSVDRAERRARRQVMVLGLLGLVAAFLLGSSGLGTLALWTDDAAVTGGAFTSGKLDLTVGGQQGNPTAYAATDLALAGMVPGESVASTISLANAGDADFTWVATVTKGGDLAGPLQVDLLVGGAATGEDTTYPRTESCSGGTAVVPGTTATRLDRGSAQSLCVKVTLPASTGDAFQNKTTGSVTIAIAAQQVVS